jgi:hypothetical protein
MAISINKLHTEIKKTLRKNSSFWASPADRDNAINRASLDILERVIMEYPQNRMRVDHGMFKIATLTVAAEDVNLPSDVYKLCLILGDDNEGDILDYRQYFARKQSVIIPPSATRPIATTYSDSGTAKVKVQPTTGITTYKIGYWKIPTTAVYAFNQSSGIDTYNPTGSVDLDWPESYYNEILNRALFYLGVTVRDPDSAQLESNS